MVTHEIAGDDMQALILTMNAGDEIRAEAGAMTYMTDGIEMDARLQGGLLGGLKRKLLAGDQVALAAAPPGRREHVRVGDVAQSHLMRALLNTLVDRLAFADSRISRVIS